MNVKMKSVRRMVKKSGVKAAMINTIVAGIDLGDRESLATMLSSNGEGGG